MLKRSIPKGAQIVCESDHDIASTKYSLGFQQPLSTRHFNWKIRPEPVDGEHHAPCPICGKRYVKSDEGHNQINVKDIGWWP